MSSVLKRLVDAFSPKNRGGYASPQPSTLYETPTIPLADVMKLYERDPTCKASVDLLAASAVGMGFYTTVNENYENATEAKRIIDQFNENVNLDALLCDMARVLIACGNEFWLKITPQNLHRLSRLPVDAVERIEQSYIQNSGLKIPDKVEGYKLRYTYGGETLKPEAVIHWRINTLNPSRFGLGILQVLLHTLTINNDKRPAYAWIKAKIERIMPKIFEKYAGPDVLALLEKADEETIQKFERVIKNRSEEGAWLFYSGKGDIKPVALDPRARFEYYIDHLINQFYLGCETPLPRLFSTPGFTEASARAALDLQNMLIKPIQRYIKRQVEHDIFDAVLAQSGLDSVKAQVRLNWGAEKTPEIVTADILKAAELGLIRPEEFRKNAVKFGWILWEKTQPETSPEGAAK
ncbi:MAG: hypothetical protein QHH18_07335 [Candidatus Bathyarchaeota archaeon]|nr:hypothetical protein [Candidatus Bathyarchaeota archaeon A05DMB-5]MDH7558394.1 hypothetical protein [Candidatus Bathyarchaeota archaeon]